MKGLRHSNYPVWILPVLVAALLTLGCGGSPAPPVMDSSGAAPGSGRQNDTVSPSATPAATQGAAPTATTAQRLTVPAGSAGSTGNAGPGAATIDPPPTGVPNAPTAAPGAAVATTAAVTPAAPAVSTQWSRRAPLLEANSETAVAELDGKVYVVGGYPFTRETVVTVQVYDAATDQWELIPPLPVPVNHGMAAGVNGKLYVIGGQASASGGSGYLNTVFEYDPQTRKWSSRAPMPTARSAGAAAVIGDKIYVAGGRPPQGQDFAVYDVFEDSWTTLPDLPTQRNHLAAAAINGRVYVVGGRFGGGWQSDMTDALEVFDPETNMWTSLAPMPTVRGGINGIAAEGCLYVFGGEGLNDRPNGVFEDTEAYDPTTDTWHKLESLPVPVHGVTGAAYIGGWIHLPGGGTHSGGSSGDTLHQVFQPPLRCG